jgi:hypothetical protein
MMQCSNSTSAHTLDMCTCACLQVPMHPRHARKHQHSSLKWCSSVAAWHQAHSIPVDDKSASSEQAATAAYGNRVGMHDSVSLLSRSADAQPSWQPQSSGLGNIWVPYMHQTSNRGSSETLSLLTALMYAIAFLLQLLSSFSSSLCLDYYFHSSLPLIASGVIFFFFPYVSSMAAAPGYIFLALPLALAACARPLLPALTTSLLDGHNQPLGSAIIGTFTSLGGLVAPAVVGSILQHTSSFRIPSYIIAAASTASGVLVLLCWKALASCNSGTFDAESMYLSEPGSSPRRGNGSADGTGRSRRSMLTAAAAMEGVSRVNSEISSPRALAMPPRLPMHPARLMQEQLQ